MCCSNCCRSCRCNKKRQCYQENSCGQNYNSCNYHYPCYQAQNFSNFPLFSSYNSGPFFSSPLSNCASSAYFQSYPNYSAMPSFQPIQKYISPPPQIPNSSFKPYISKAPIQPCSLLPRFKKNGC